MYEDDPNNSGQDFEFQEQNGDSSSGQDSLPASEDKPRLEERVSSSGDEGQRRQNLLKILGLSLAGLGAVLLIGVIVMSLFGGEEPKPTRTPKRQQPRAQARVFDFGETCDVDAGRFYVSEELDGLDRQIDEFGERIDDLGGTASQATIKFLSFRRRQLSDRLAQVREVAEPYSRFYGDPGGVRFCSLAKASHYVGFWLTKLDKRLADMESRISQLRVQPAGKAPSRPPSEPKDKPTPSKPDPKPEDKTREVAPPVRDLQEACQCSQGEFDYNYSQSVNAEQGQKSISETCYCRDQQETKQLAKKTEACLACDTSYEYQYRANVRSGQVVNTDETCGCEGDFDLELKPMSCLTKLSQSDNRK